MDGGREDFCSYDVWSYILIERLVKCVDVNLDDVDNVVSFCVVGCRGMSKVDV